MTDLLLAFCPWEKRSTVKFEHLGLSSLASFLDSHGISVTLLDANLFPRDIPQIVNDIESSSCRHVGFSVMRTNSMPTLETVRALRSRLPSIHVTLGGHEATHAFREILSEYSEVDSIVMGEGEYTLLELCRRIRDGLEWRDVEGICYRDLAGKVICNPRRPLIKDLDSLPLPDRSLYRLHLSQAKVASVYSSRGCHGQCKFCGINTFYGSSPGPKWRGRSPENVVDEVEILVRDYGVDAVLFRDDDFIGPGSRGRQRARQIGEELLSRDLDIGYSFSCRPDNVDEPLFRFLRKTGLFRVNVGIESWLPRQLDLYRKNMTPDQNHRAIDILKKTGLDFDLYLIPFDPYLTIDELLHTLEIVEKVGLEHLPLNHLFNTLRLNNDSPLHGRFRLDGLNSFKKDAAFGAQTLYAFQHKSTERAYLFGEAVLARCRDVFEPLFYASNSHRVLPIRLFLNAVEIATRRWVVTRYKRILRQLKTGPYQSGETLFQDFYEELEELLDSVHETFEKIAQKGSGFRTELRIDGEVLHFPPAMRPQATAG